VKNMIKILIIALTTLSFTGLSFAQAKPATPATPAAPATEKKMETTSEKAKTNTVTGEVTSLDAKAGTFAVKTKDKEIKLSADSKSAKGALEKLNVGDKVKVSYTEKDGKMIASSVKAEGKTTATKPATTEKKSDVAEKKPATK
jgi:translation initiation factor IF-1